MLTVSGILIAAADLIERTDWCAEDQQNAAGEFCLIWDQKACRFSAYGAIDHVLDRGIGRPYGVYYDMAMISLRETIGDQDVAAWNRKVNKWDAMQALVSAGNFALAFGDPKTRAILHARWQADKTKAATA